MPVALTSLLLHVGADTHEAESGLGRVNEHVGRMGGLIGVTSLAFTGGMGVIAAGVMTAGRSLRGFLDNAMEAQNVSTQLNAVLKSTGGVSGVTRGAIDQLADKMSTLTTYTDEAYRASATVLAGFTHIGKEMFPQVEKAAADVAARLGIDLPSAAKKLGLAFQDPEKGMARLRSLQIVLTDEQKKSIKTFEAHGNIIAAQGVLLDAVKAKFGGAAEAAGKTLAGQLAILSNRWQEMKERIGLTVLPAINAVVAGFTSAFIAITDKLQPGLDSLTQVFNKAGESATRLWNTAIQPLGKAFTAIRRDVAFLSEEFKNHFLDALYQTNDAADAVTTKVSGLGAVFSGTKTQIVTAWQEVKTLLTDKTIGRSLESLQKPMQQLGATLGGALRTALVQFGQFWILLKPQLVASLPYLVHISENMIALGQALLPLVGLLNPILSIFKQFAPLLLPLIPVFFQLADIIQTALVKNLAIVTPSIVHLVSVIEAGLAPILADLIPVVAQVAGVLGKVLVVVLNTLGPLIATIADALAKQLGPILKQLEPILKPVIAAIGSWISQMADVLMPLIQALGALLMKILPPVLEFLGGRISWLFDIFKAVWPLIFTIVDVAMTNIRNVIKIVTDIISGNWSQLGKDLQKFATDMLGGLWRIISTGFWSLVDLIKTFISPLLDAILKPFHMTQDSLGAIWKAIGNTIVDSVNTFAIGSFNGFISNIAKAVDWVADKLGAGKPLANAEKGILGNIPRFARGGVTSGGAAIVGEEGSELAIFPSGTRIMPHGSFSEGSGTGGSDGSDQGSMSDSGNILGDLFNKIGDWFTKGAGWVTQQALSAFHIGSSFGVSPFGDLGGFLVSAMRKAVDGFMSGAGGGDIGAALKSPGYHWWTGNLIQSYHDPRNRAHGGIDMHAAFHTPLVALLGGTVYRGDYRPWGGELDLWSNLPGYGRGLENYTHLDYILPQYTHPGAYVPSGAVIGLSGGQPSGGLHPAHGFSGGPHLHYNWFRDRPWAHDDLNPTPFLNTLRSNKLPVYFAEGGWITEPIVGYGQRTGTPYMFGERGNELVVPGNKMGSGGSGSGNGIVIYASNADSKTLAEHIAREIYWQQVVRGNN